MESCQKNSHQRYFNLFDSRRISKKAKKQDIAMTVFRVLDSSIGKCTG